MPSATTYLFFVQTVPGLETLVQDELSLLGINAKLKSGGVEFRGTRKDLFRVCLLSRVAESVRIRLKVFRAREFSILQKELRKLPFSAFLPRGAAVELKVVCHKSRLWHSGAVEERVRKVLSEHVGLSCAKEGESAAHQIHLRLTDDEVQVSLDASGERLHRRGMRTRVERASLRETLGAALFLSSWKQRKESEVLWDPFCGAGTIVLEALSIAHGQVAGQKRSFAFEQFRGHEAAEFAQLRAQLEAETSKRALCPSLRVIASDRDQHAMESTAGNLKNAGLADSAELHTADIEEVASKVPEGAMVVTNPPYGKRLQETEALGKLRKLLKKRKDLRPCVVLVGDAARRSLGNEGESLFQTKNGGVSVSARLLQ